MTSEMRNSRRIAVIGTCGTGKTALARELSSTLGIPHVELDEVHWSENWVEVSTEVFRADVIAQAAHESWIMDGNYGVVRDVIWNRADTIIWLDYSFLVMLQRLVIRTLIRMLCRTPVWHGNKETFERVISRDSIIWWGISTYSRRKKEYGQLWKSKELQETKLVRFTEPKQAADWLRQLKRNAGVSADC
jgi:adenylate kinase family enzyme